MFLDCCGCAQVLVFLVCLCAYVRVLHDVLYMHACFLVHLHTTYA